MKKFLLICLIMLMTTSLFGAMSKRHIEESAGYSICLPNMWQFTDIFHMKYRVIMWRKEEFAPRMIVIDDKYTGTLDPYVDATIENFKKEISVFKMIEKKEFITENGMKGIKLVSLGTQSGTRIRKVCYFFKKPDNTTFIVLCNCLAKNKRTEITFDKIITTLQFE